LIKDISKNKTLILSTHIMQEVEAICDKVVIINKGKIVASDHLKNLKSTMGKNILLLETEENLDLDWFVDFGEANFVGQSKQSITLIVDDVTASRKSILKLVQQRGLTLISIQQQERNLESIFHQITKQ
jgi:ABC-2 type transport system ATP-binding protein